MANKTTKHSEIIIDLIKNKASVSDALYQLKLLISDLYDKETGKYFTSEAKKGIKDIYFSVFRSEKSDDAFKKLAEKLEMVEDKEDFVLDVLSDIHND